MKKTQCYSVIMLVTVAVLSTITSCNKEETERPAITVMAYYMEGDHFNPRSLKVEKLTHIIYSFTEVIDNSMAFPDNNSAAKLHRLVAQKKRNSDLKVLIACGGWGGSGGFSDMSATKETRDIFIKSTIDFINEFQLDGVDIDWEYPGQPGAGNPYRPEDRENFTSLMKELREAMDATGKQLILTFAAGASERFFEHVDLTEVMKYVDYMNLMTYDYVTGGSRFTAHHTNLGKVTLDDIRETPYFASIEDRYTEAGGSVEDYHPRGVDAIVDYCIGLGTDPQQIVIGAAFYGRAFIGVPPRNNGLYQPNRGVFRGRTSYAGIRDRYEDKNGFTRYWDRNARAPFLYNENDSVFISYDDTVSVRLKTEYAIGQNLGGIMFWQLGGDTSDKNGLLDAIYKASLER